MSYLLFIGAFLILTGIALLYSNVLKLNMAEGFVTAVATIIACLYLTNGSFSSGLKILTILGIAGYIVGILLNLLKKDGEKFSHISSLYFLMLCCLVAGGIFAYHGDFIQHIDELHQWAAAVKYMLQKGHIPIAADFTDPNQKRGTSLFHLYFQMFAGYKEALMYLSGTLLVWIGFLLPFGNDEKKDWKKALLFSAVTFLGMNVLYSYGTKNILVDMPVAAWTAGLIGWWSSRTKKKQNILVLAAGLWLLYTFKSFVGLLMAVYVILFVIIYELVIHGKRIRKKGWIALKILSVLTTIGMVGVRYVGFPYLISRNESGSLPSTLSSLLSYSQFSEKKIHVVTGAFLGRVWGTPLASAKSEIKLSLVAFFIILFALMYLASQITKKKEELKGYAFFFGYMTVTYLFVLYCAFMVMFAYEEAVDTISIERYFGTIAVAVLAVFVSWTVRQIQIADEDVVSIQSRRLTYLLLSMLCFFGLSMNKAYIANNTSWDPKNVKGYLDTIETRRESEVLRKYLGKKDKVYLINQLGEPNGGEYNMASASYYLGSQVSSYLVSPWKFTEDGSYIHNTESDLSVKDIPALLEEKHYDYLWVYRSNMYLNNNLAKVMRAYRNRNPEYDNKAHVKTGMLYHIRYNASGHIKEFDAVHTFNPPEEEEE